jgi:hypothetical protein
MSIDSLSELLEKSATFRSFALDGAEELAPECVSNVPLRQSRLKSLAQEGGGAIKISC